MSAASYSGKPAISASARREHGAHSLDELIAFDRLLRRPILDPGGAAVRRLGELGAERQVLQGHLAARAFVVTFDDDDRGVALVGIFELRIHAGFADIVFGAQARGAELPGQAEAVRDRPLVEN